MEKKSKKPLIALLVVVIIGVIGFTFAFFSDKINVNNIFKTKEYGTTVTEVFTSPDNWTPGTTTDKTVVATNNGNVDETVRISYTEKWVSNDGTELSGWVDENGNLTDQAEELATDERAVLINFDNESDWTLSNGYYYYNYKLAPGEVTTSFIKSVTFNSIVQSSSDCPKTVTGGSQTITCTSTGKGYDGATYTLTFTIETVQYDQYKNAWGTSVEIANEKPKTGVQILLSKANGVEVTDYIDGDIHEMYTFSHEATEQTPALIDYRYIGDSPNNYVKFNCKIDENTSEEVCETWRIVGVFSVDDGTEEFKQRIKLVRESILNKKMELGGPVYGKYTWVGSTLQTYLSEEYFDDLSLNSQLMIDNVIYYLGCGSPVTTTEEIYSWERGTERNFYNIYIKWKGKISLLYPSDYGYTYSKGVDDICYLNPNNCPELEPWAVPKENSGDSTKSWIYNTNNTELIKLLNPSVDDSVSLSIGKYGTMDTIDVRSSDGIRPVVYLTSDVKITSGDGTSSNPYQLSK